MSEAEIFLSTDLSPEDGAEIVNSGDETETNGFKLLASRRRKPYQYSDTDDIAILKEVLVEQAPRKGAVDKWKLIFEHVQLPVKDYRAIKTRFDILFKAFKKDENASFRGSGLEEDFKEKQRLLTEIAAGIDDWPATQKSNLEKDDNQQKAKQIREEALKGLSASPDDGTPPAKRSRHRPSEFYEIVKNSEASEQEHKKFLMEMESKRLALMERDMKRQEENDAHRREMERKTMEMEQKRVEQESRRLELEQIRMQNEKEERAAFMKLLANRQ